MLLVQGSNLQLHCTANMSNNVPVRALLDCTNRRATYMLFLNLSLAANNSGYACCTHRKHDLIFCFPLTLRSHPGSGKAPSDRRYTRLQVPLRLNVAQQLMNHACYPKQGLSFSVLIKSLQMRFTAFRTRTTKKTSPAVLPDTSLGTT